MTVASGPAPNAGSRPKWRIATGRTIATSDAIEQLACWFEVPTLMLLGEGPGYWDVLRRVVKRSRIVGPRVHDARIDALCLHHGVREIWTADRDFRRFDGLAATNPLIRGG